MSNLINEQILEIREHLKKFINDNPQISNRQIANNIGKSTTLVNQFINDKYPTPSTLSDFAFLIKNYLDNEQLVLNESVSKGHLKFAETSAAKDIFRIANYALTAGKIGVITGVAGCGKSIAADEYKRKNPITILIRVTPLVTPRILLDDICAELKIPKAFYRDTMFKSIVNRLKGTNLILIIDEGENLNTQCLEVIRRVQDFTGIGMLLLGTGRLLDRLRGPKRELQQLFSRVGIQKEIKLLVLNDVKLILGLNFPPAVKFANTFLQLSKQNGRLLEHLIALVKTTIQNTDEELSDDLIDEAASSLLT